MAIREHSIACTARLPGSQAATQAARQPAKQPMTMAHNGHLGNVFPIGMARFFWHGFISCTARHACFGTGADVLTHFRYVLCSLARFTMILNSVYSLHFGVYAFGWTVASDIVEAADIRT